MSAEDVTPENIKEDISKSILVPSDNNYSTIIQEKKLYENSNNYQTINDQTQPSTKGKKSKDKKYLYDKLNFTKNIKSNLVVDIKGVNQVLTGPSELLPPKYHHLSPKDGQAFLTLQSDLRRECSPNSMNWNIQNQFEFNGNITMIKALTNTNLLAVAEDQLHLFNTKLNTISYTFDNKQIPSSPITCACSTSLQKLIVGSLTGDIFVYDYFEYKLTHTFRNICPGKIKALIAVEVFNAYDTSRSKTLVYVHQQNDKVCVLDFYFGKIIDIPKLSEILNVKFIALNQTSGAVAILSENKILIVNFNGADFFFTEIKVDGKQNYNALYWQEEKLHLVSNQFISIYNEKGLEKNYKYLAIARIIETSPQLLVAKDEKNYLWIAEDFYPYMLVSKVQRSHELSSVKECPFAKLPVKGEFLEKLNKENIAISFKKKLFLLDTSISFSEKSKIIFDLKMKDHFSNISTSFGYDTYACIVNDTKIEIRNIQNKEILDSIDVETKNKNVSILNLKLSKDNSKVDIIFSDGYLKVYSISGAKEPIHETFLGDENITQIHYTDDGDHFMFLGSDCIIKLFECKKYTEISTSFELILQNITAGAIYRDYFLLGNAEGSIRRYNFLKELQLSYRSTDSKIKQVAYNHDGQKIIVLYTDLQKIHIFNIFESKEEREIEVNVDIDFISVPHKKLEYIVCALKKLSIKIFDFHGREIFCFHTQSNYSLPILLEDNLSSYFGVKITSMSFSSLCSHLMVSLSNGCYGIYKLGDEKPVKKIEISQHNKNLITQMISTEKEKYIISALDSNVIQVFESETCEKILEYLHFGDHIKIITEISSELIISASKERVVVYSIPERNIKYQLSLHAEVEILTSVKFNPKKECLFYGYLTNASDDLDTSSKKTENHDVFYLKGVKVGSDSYELYSYKTSNVKTGMLTPDETKIVLGMRNGTIKIIDYMKKIKIRSFKRVDIQPISNITITSDSNYLITVGTNQLMKVIDLFSFQERYEYVPLREQQFQISVSNKILRDQFIIFNENGKIMALDIHSKFISEIYRSKSKKIMISNSADGNSLFLTSNMTEIMNLKLPFYTSDDLCLTKVFIPNLPFTRTLHPLLNLYKPWNVKDWPEVYISSYRFNFLHLLAILEPQNLLSIPPYSLFKVSFLVDKFGKTPFHYLLANESIEIPVRTNIFRYMIDFLEDKQKSDPSIFEVTIKSLEKLVPYLVNKMTNQKDVLRFLNLHLFEPFNEFGHIVPTFGKCINGEMIYSKYPALNPHTKQLLWKNGPDRVQFYTSILLPNFNILSDSTLYILFALSSVNSQEYFKTKAVSSLLDYLWERNKRYHYILGSIFLIYLSLISAYIIKGDDRSIGLETSIITFAFIMLLYEFLRFYSLRLSYLKRPGNYVDMGYFIFMIALIIVRYSDEKSIITRQWLYATSILVGYGKLISFLRMFSLTRNLIRAMFVIFRKLIGFFVVLVLIIFGFGIVFLEFDRTVSFPAHLVESYNSLFGNSNTSYNSFSINFLSISIAFVLNVYLLNMLVTVIGNSLSEFNSVSVLNDSKERISFIMESTLVKRVLFHRRSEDNSKKCIIFCEQSGMGEDDETDELKTQIGELQSKLARVEERFGNDMARFEEHLFRMEEKIEETLNKKLDNIVQYLENRDDEINENMAKNLVTQDFIPKKMKTDRTKNDF